MAILTEQVEERSQGFVKTINKNAVGLMLDNLQKYQYQFPIKSTIRELVCNGLDAVIDRESALDIIENNAPVSKYFEDNKGELYSDSKFDPSYYNLSWLSRDKKVYIDYYEGKNQERDYITVSDFAIGLSKKRLEGYFELGWSTKRNSKSPVGKFGINGPL